MFFLNEEENLAIFPFTIQIESVKVHLQIRFETASESRFYIESNREKLTFLSWKSLPTPSYASAPPFEAGHDVDAF